MSSRQPKRKRADDDPKKKKKKVKMSGPGLCEWELGALVRESRLTTDERRSRTALKARTLRCIQSVWPEATMETFGSSETKLEWFESDIDVRVRNGPRDPARGCLILGRYLQTMEWATQIETRPRARVPIVRFRDTRSGVDCDVSFGGPMAQDWFTKEGPLFFDVVLVLKIFFRVHKLDKPFDGGIGSFRLAVLVQHFLKTTTSSSNVVATLRRFFSFGVHFDFLHTSLRAKNLDVTYGNVDGPRVRRVCRTALAALDTVHRHERSATTVLGSSTHPCIAENLLSPHSFTNLAASRKLKRTQAETFCRIYLNHHHKSSVNKNKLA